MELTSVVFNIMMLLAGIILTAITMLRMRSGKIDLPGWGKFLLCTAMIAMLVITVLSMLPPSVLHLVEEVFIDEHTHIVTPSDTTPSVTAAQ